MKPQGPLFRELATGLCHCTSVKGYQGIIDTGNILPNDGTFPFSFPQTANSCCQHLDSISLFDFETPPSESVFDHTAYSNWSPFINLHPPVTVILKIRREALSEEIIENHHALELSDGHSLIWPVEACYPGAIPLEAIDGCVVTSWLSRTRFQSCSELPSIEDLGQLNRKFRAPIVSGEEQHGHHTFGESVFVTRLDVDSTQEQVVLRLSVEPDSDRGLSIAFEGVSDLDTQNWMQVPPEYVEIIKSVATTCIRNNTQSQFDAEPGIDIPAPRGPGKCKISTDVRKIEFRAESVSYGNL